MEENERLELDTINHLRQVEIRFHLAKMVFIAVVSIMAAGYIILAVRHDNDRTRSYIKCIVTRPASTPDQYRQQVNKCQY